MGDFGEDNELINNTNWMVTRGRTLPPLKIGDFGDQSYSLHILSLFKTNFDLHTYLGLKIGDFGDPSYLANNTQHAFRV